MKFNSSNRIENKLARYKRFAQKLQKLESFQPTDSQRTVAHFLSVIGQGISDHKALQDAETQKEGLVDKRLKMYNSNSDSLMKRLTLINKQLNSSSQDLGETAVKVQKTIRRMRGPQHKVLAATVSKEATPTEDKTAKEPAKKKQHLTTYDIRLMDLDHITRLCNSLGANYNPANQWITVSGLEALYRALENVNMETEAQKEVFKKLRLKRSRSLDEMKEIGKGIKDLLISQYKNQAEVMQLVEDFVL
ncbi:MAG: hypothetical protein OIF50_11075 [Flavobacteriaceae bacterium]|nr:hypothetical protein [Flavobacteriaceae bacterium]